VVGPQVAHRNAGDLRNFAADKGYDKNAFRELLRDNDVRPLVRHCLYTVRFARNARLDDSLYNKRWMAETCFSVVKRSHGPPFERKRGTVSSENAFSNSPSTASNEPAQRYDLDAVPLFKRVQQSTVSSVTPNHSQKAAGKEGTVIRIQR